MNGECKFIYCVREDEIQDGDNMRLAYGLEIRADGSDEPIRIVRDISGNREKLSELAELCSEQELSPVHIDDVLEDFLSDFRVLC